MQHLCYDVEATGASAITHSMIEIGFCDEKLNTYNWRMRPLPGRRIDPGALKAIGVTAEEILDWPDPAIQMCHVGTFLQDMKSADRIQSWSDNPGFDWQFLNGYLHEFCGGNPLGFSTRRIGDLYAGFTMDVKNATKWKKFRRTKHTHRAADDAKGNMEALLTIFDHMAVQ